MSRTLRWVAACLAAAAALTPCHAADHLMVIQEVFPGTPSDPNAQYVMLRMTSSGQTFVNADFAVVQDAAGTVLGRFGTITHNVAAGGIVGCEWGDCPAIVIGTAAAQTLLGFTFDQVVDGQAGRVALPASGGRLCWNTTATGAADCVAWGSFTAPNTTPTSTSFCDTNYGLPAAALRAGFALERTAFLCAAKENSLDFANLFPHPEANSGGNANVDSDFDELIDVLDCGDSDPTSLYAPLGVAALDAAGGATVTLSWTAERAPAGSSLVYDVTRGNVADLRVAGSCEVAAAGGTVVATVSSLSAMDTGVPSPGDGFFYLVRSRSGCGPSASCSPAQ